MQWHVSKSLSYPLEPAQAGSSSLLFSQHLASPLLPWIYPVIVWTYTSIYSLDAHHATAPVDTHLVSIMPLLDTFSGRDRSCTWPKPILDMFCAQAGYHSLIRTIPLSPPQPPSKRCKYRSCRVPWRNPLWIYHSKSSPWLCHLFPSAPDSQSQLDWSTLVSRSFYSAVNPRS